MSNSYFKVIRAGINTTFQDEGRNNLYHIGIPFSGVMDNTEIFERILQALDYENLDSSNCSN